MVVGKAIIMTEDANMTKGNMTGAAMGAAKNMTGSAMGAAKNTTGK